MILTIIPRDPPPPPRSPLRHSPRRYTIPGSIGKLAGLQKLDLSHTGKWDGTKYVGGISGTILKTLITNYGFPKHVMIQRSDTDTPTLQHSHDSGSIPKEVGALAALTSLYLHSTSIEGTLKIKGMKLYHS
jgi:hypothetical protein